MSWKLSSLRISQPAAASKSENSASLSSPVTVESTASSWPEMGSESSFTNRTKVGKVVDLGEGALADALVARGVRIDVLNVNHHGASNSSRPEFIQKLSPLVEVISVGDDNEYDHSSARPLTTLYGRGVRVYQTEAGQRAA